MTIQVRNWQIRKTFLNADVTVTCSGGWRGRMKRVLASWEFTADWPYDATATRIGAYDGVKLVNGIYVPIGLEYPVPAKCVFQIGEAGTPSVPGTTAIQYQGNALVSADGVQNPAVNVVHFTISGQGTGRTDRPRCRNDYLRGFSERGPPCLLPSPQPLPRAFPCRGRRFPRSPQDITGETAPIVETNIASSTTPRHSRPPGRRARRRGTNREGDRPESGGADAASLVPVQSPMKGRNRSRAKPRNRRTVRASRPPAAASSVPPHAVTCRCRKSSSSTLSRSEAMPTTTLTRLTRNEFGRRGTPN